MLNEPINSGSANFLDFGEYAPTWGILLGFVVILTVYDLLKIRTSQPASQSTGLQLLKSLPLSFALSLGATLVCLLICFCGVLGVQALAGVIMKLFSELRPMPVLKIAVSWTGFLASLYFAWQVIAYRNRGGAANQL